MAAEINLITKESLARTREIDFAWQFNGSIAKLQEILGVTRKVEKQEGTVLKAYKATGTLQSGEVAEGELIPLSKYQTEAVNLGEIVLKKWRQATSVEAITDRGYDQAVDMVTDRMLKDVQKNIRKNLVDFLATGTGKASGTNVQGALAQAWGQLQVLFEDDAVESVYFMNPLDIADYLAGTDITTQTAFGMTYVENFLGLGTVITTAAVPKGTIYATAKENIVMYFIPVNGAGINQAFTFVSDASGYIGIHTEPNYSNMTTSSTAICGITFFAERVDGVVVATIGAQNEKKVSEK